MSRTSIAILAASLVYAAPAAAQETDYTQLRDELTAAKARIDALERRLQSMEARGTPSPLPASGSAAAPGWVGERVGQAPEDERPPEIAVLGDQGAVITRAGQLTGELTLEYARADRNRAIFRGIELVESVLVGVFDINESRQDVLSAAAGLRYGLTDRLEVGVRVPFVRRFDRSILAPVAGSTNNDEAATIDSSASRNGLGDVEASLRYQLTRASSDKPFFIANLQVVAPTGSSPFEVRRDEAGRAQQAATGAGFWGVTPSVTAILPTDPAVLFANIGYTHNLADDVDTFIPPVRIVRVKPGDAIGASVGIGLALNPRTSLNLGYAHSWAFGTRTTTEVTDPDTDEMVRSTTRARDLQIGRLLFGVTYRVNNTTSVNWGVEVGATEDATDLRTTLRVPITLVPGS